MKAIEQAVRNAIFAGFDRYELGNFLRAGIEWDEISWLFFEPSFWQALFKEYKTGRPFNIHARTKPQWLNEMHNFIDHLAEGKDAESFFSSLTPNAEK